MENITPIQTNKRHSSGSLQTSKRSPSKSIHNTITSKPPSLEHKLLWKKISEAAAHTALALLAHNEQKQCVNPLKAAKHGNSETFIGEKAVYKMDTPVQCSEEKLIYNLANIVYPKSVVPQIPLTSFSPFQSPGDVKKPNRSLKPEWLFLDDADFKISNREYFLKEILDLKMDTSVEVTMPISNLIKSSMSSTSKKKLDLSKFNKKTFNYSGKKNVTAETLISDSENLLIDFRTKIHPDKISFTASIDEISTPQGSILSMPTTVKLFINNLILFGDLTVTITNVILKRISPDSIINSIMTLDFQFYDLHKNNLAFTTTEHELFLKYKESTFTYNSQSYSLSHLFNMHDQGLINLYDSITVNNNTFIIQGSDIEKLLNAKWELVLFDIDNSMGGNNLFRTIDDETFLCLHSALFATTWKDQPFNSSILNTITHQLDKASQEALLWMEGKYNIGYQRTHSLKGVKTGQFALLNKHLKDLLEKENITPSDVEQSFKAFKEKIKNHPIKDCFYCDIAENNELLKQLFYSRITLEKLITFEWQEYSFGPSQFKNSSSIEEFKILFARKLCINDKHPIWNCFDAKKFNTKFSRFTLAKQLAPHATHYQIQAYKERLLSKKNYLIHFQELEKALSYNFKAPSADHFDEWVKPVIKFIHQEPNLLCTAQKDKFNEALNTRNAEMISSILASLRPSFFNLAKSMYPLLANAYEHNITVHSTEFKAGYYLGQQTYSFEKQMKQSPSRQDEQLTREHLLQSLKSYDLM